MFECVCLPPREFRSGCGENWETAVVEPVKRENRSLGGRDWAASLGRWLLGRRSADARSLTAANSTPRFRVVAISRETGAGGGTIGRLLGQRLGWKVYNREIPDTIAEWMNLPPEEVAPFDELAPSVVQDWILPLREEVYAPQEAYLDHLDSLLGTLGRQGSSVIVGRGAGCFLPRESTLTVRVIAPLQQRAERLAERMGVSVRTARRAARDLDKRRDRFIRTLYRVDPTDPHQYDLVLDSASLGLTMAAELLARAVEVGYPAAFSCLSEDHPTATSATARSVVECEQDPPSPAA